MRWCGGGGQGGIILLIPAPVPVYYSHYSAAVPPHLQAGEFALDTETRRGMLSIFDSGLDK